MEQEFIRVGFYIHNEFKGERDEGQLEVAEVIEKTERVIIASKPRITKFDIEWRKQEEKKEEKEGNGEIEKLESLGCEQREGSQESKQRKLSEYFEPANPK